MTRIEYRKAGQVVWYVAGVNLLSVYVLGHRVGFARDLTTALAMVRYHRGRT